MRVPLLALGVAALLCLTWPAQALGGAPVAAAGVGEGSTFAFCNPNVRVAVAGARTDAGWTFQLVMLRHPNCIVFLVPASFSGAWDPQAGGCMAGAPPIGGTLCIGGIQGLQGTAPWRLCAQAGTCDPGSANFQGTVALTVA